MNQPARPAFHPASAAGFPRAAAPQPSGRPGFAPAAPGQPGRPAGPQRPHAPQPGPGARPAGQGAPQRPYAPPAQRPYSPPPAGPAPRQYAPQPGPATPPRPYAPANGGPGTPPLPYAASAGPVAAPSVPSFPPAGADVPPGAGQPEPLGPPPRPRKRKIGRWIALLVIAGGVGGAVWYGTHTAPASTNVGDCVAQTGSDSLAKVACGDPSARFRVAGRLENRTRVDASLGDACKAFPKVTSSYWEGESGKPGLLLCLEPVVPVPAAK